MIQSDYNFSHVMQLSCPGKHKIVTWVPIQYKDVILPA